MDWWEGVRGKGKQEQGLERKGGERVVLWARLLVNVSYGHGYVVRMQERRRVGGEEDG